MVLFPLLPPFGAEPKIRGATLNQRQQGGAYVVGDGVDIIIEEGGELTIV
jgi:hypothetical protein